MNKYIETCICCEKEMPDYDPKMCCDGFECGCRGQPTEPPVCSIECYDKEFGEKKNG